MFKKEFDKDTEVLINYTVYLEGKHLEEDELEQYVAYIEQRHYHIIDELGYSILAATYGVHRNAKRMHMHYHTKNAIPLGSKHYKILNDKIKRLKCFQEHILPHKNFKLPEVKITFKYKYELDYDWWKSLAYPLKEYSSDEEMNKEVTEATCINVTECQLGEMRYYANDIYNESQKQRIAEVEKQNKKADLYSHLDEVIITSNIPHYKGEIEILVRYTVKHMLMYYKMKNQNFSIHQLKNVAINYLYFKEIIDEGDIVIYAQI